MSAARFDNKKMAGLEDRAGYKGPIFETYILRGERGGRKIVIIDEDQFRTYVQDVTHILDLCDYLTQQLKAAISPRN